MRALIRSVAPSTLRGRLRGASRSTARARWPRTGTTSTRTGRTAASRSRTRTPRSRRCSGPTYGLMVYQEQLMRVSQQLAGYSLEDADNLRKATGKKIRELIAKERDEVRRRLRRAGPRARVRRADVRHDRAVRRLLVQQVAHRRVRPRHVPDRVPQGEPPARVPRRAAHERQGRQGQVRGLPERVPADGDPGARSRTSTSPTMDFVVRRTTTGTTAEGEPIEVSAIRFGLSAVRNVGEGVVAKIIEARDEGGPFTDFYDLCERVDPIGAEQADDRVADQGRGVRLARPPAPGPVPRLRGDRRRDPRPPARARRRDHEPVRRRA